MSLIFKHFIYKEFEHRWKDVKKLRVFTLKKKSTFWSSESHYACIFGRVVTK